MINNEITLSFPGIMKYIWELAVLFVLPSDGENLI